jgi:hypothetical protein
MVAQHLNVAGAPAPRRRQIRKTVAKAAATGDRRELLVALRERIATTVSDPECPPRDLSSLTRRLQEIAKEIEQLDIAESETRSVIARTDDERWDATAI